MDAKLAGTDRARALALFATVVEAGSFSSAARTLDMSPSAVARAVDRIEQRLGVRLLLRSTRALSLTAEGQAYLLAARRILADLDDAEQQIADQGSPRGRLRVSAALSHGRLCVVPLLGRFSVRYPDILVDIALTDTLVDIAGGQADVAVRFGPLPDSTLTARKLGETGRVIVASPEYLERCGTPEVPEDLHRHNCLNFNFRRAEPVWPFRRADQDFTLAVKGRIEANNGETLGQLAALGVGIARVGSFSVAEEIARGQLVPLLEAFNPGDVEQIHAVFVGGASTPARIRAFVEFLALHLRGGS
ncbi:MULTISPECIES: LysR family transcriptional regulator [Sphingomonas]|uniref:LysR family transcriptional regulator n=1 Tax=Sphingomonas molluscorum TaxID=418184 RepID=A0ABU8QAJ1_9SPHN|nr:LysR family transcriptional regulator [Sphingomonas sp. JUb134]MBM7408116.1 DNA-binding transcriptional LysR family regulator [Sphingomonas sp. JUb134]